MPQEFLRDVLRPGDVKSRRRRLSVLPVSIAIHAVVLTIFLFSPWIVDAELPVVASPVDPHYVPTVPPPPPPEPPPLAPAHTAPASAVVPVEAPPVIVPESPVTPSNAVPHSVGPAVSSSVSLIDGIGDRAEVTLPPAPPPPTPSLVRIGGGIREPRKLVHVAPIYPEIARISRIEGKVTMEAILDATGRVESVRVLSSAPLLEDAAVRAVKQWRYTPTELNGVPVPVLMTITVVFTLHR